MTFSHVNRRAHLYLGLGLVPWVLMYGVSSIPFAHSQYLQQRDDATGRPLWTLRAEIPVDAAVPVDQDGLRAFGAAMLDRAGIRPSSFGTYRQSPTQVNVYAYSFWHSTQLKYFTDRHLLRVEDRRFRWDQFLTGMHARGGFEQDGALQSAWSIVVDLVCLALIGWVASGAYMWWELPRHRAWGGLTLGLSVLAFVAFTVSL